MITADDHVKLLDFGLVKKLRINDPAGSRSSVKLTSIGVVLGTAGYMSPEQARGEELDPRSDLFSLGCVIYQAATGKPAFEGKTPIAVMYQIFQGKPQPPSSIRNDLPKDFDRIMEKALTKDRNLRYQTATELASDLRSLSNKLTPEKPGV